MKTRCTPKGFTLIELAVVIAIIAILAAVAIPRFGNVTVQAERAMAADMVSQLTSAAAIYTAQMAATPEPTQGFTRFVDGGAVTVPTGNRTLALGNFGTNPGTCNVTVNTVACNGTFANGNATYTWNGGSITCTTTIPPAGNC